MAIIAIHPSGPATVIAASRVSLPFEERSVDAIGKAIIASLSEAGEKARAAYAASDYKNATIVKACAVIRAPWTRSKVERATNAMEKDTRITDAMIGTLAQQAIAADTELDRARLIESSVVRVELNGYQTASPVGKSARTLSAVVLMSDCESEILSGLDETLRRLFPEAKPVLRSGTRALLAAAESQFSRDYVILDVEGEASNAIIVRDGLAAEHLLIPEGVRSILKRISAKGLPEETLSNLRMIERSESSGDAVSETMASVARVEIELARVYGEGLMRIAAISRLPNDLVLVTHPDLAPWLSRFFSRIDFTQCTITAQPFNVRALQIKDLAESVVVADTSPIDIGIAISSALVNTEEHP